MLSLVTLLSFIYNRHLKGFIAFIAVLELIAGLWAIYTIAALTFKSMYSPPFSPDSSRFAFLLPSYYILCILSMYLVNAMVTEKVEGTVLLHLSQPITRTEYIAGWLLAAIFTPVVAMFIAIVSLTAIVSPVLLATLGLRAAALLALQCILISTMYFAAAYFSKSRTLVFMIGILLLFILPILLAILISYIQYSFGSSSTVYQFAVVLYGVIYPLFYSFGANASHIPPVEYPAAGSLCLIVAILACTLAHCRHRFEVS